MIKKLLSLVTILSLLFIFSASAIDYETSVIATMKEQPLGRSVSCNSSELVTIWYTGTTNPGHFGVSGNVAIGGVTQVAIMTTIYFYEGGTRVTANRFNGATAPCINPFGATADTVQGVVDSINSDTSGFWHAAVGRDATPGTSVSFIWPQDIRTAARRESTAIVDGDVLRDRTFKSMQLLAGFNPNKPSSNLRLKRIEETVSGTGTHNVEVWNDNEEVYRRTYTSQSYVDVTPLTIAFTDYGGVGLAVLAGNNLVVVSDWTTAITINDSNYVNLNIIVGDWTP